MSWWEPLLAVASLLALAIIAIGNLRNIPIVPRPRLTLRADLEILKLLEPTDENYQIVKATVDSSIRSIYQTLDRRTVRERFRVYDWFSLILGIVVLGGLGWWTVNLVEGGLWWAILTGIFALIGLFTMLGAFTEPRRGKSTPYKVTKERVEAAVTDYVARTYGEFPTTGTHLTVGNVTYQVIDICKLLASYTGPEGLGILRKVPVSCWDSAAGGDNNSNCKNCAGEGSADSHYIWLLSPEGNVGSICHGAGCKANNKDGFQGVWP